MSTAISTASGSAHGKVILFGEHAVVHGTDALATALDRGVTVTATRRLGPTVLAASPWGYTVNISDNTPGGRALQAIFRTLNVKPSNIALHAHAQIPGRSGLGASAALAAATTRALCELDGLALSDEELFDCVQCSEAVFHGNPSGIDAQIALFGGTLIFNKDRAPQRLDPPDLHLSVVHSGRPGETGTTVRSVAQKCQRHPEARKRLADIQRIVTEAARALQTGDVTPLGPLMNQNQAHLEWFGVSTEELGRICALAKSNGAAGAKLTGGGGGGCAIILEPPNSHAATSALSEAGFEIIIP